MEVLDVITPDPFNQEELEALGRGTTPVPYVMLMVLLALGVVAALGLILWKLSEQTIFIFIANGAMVLFGLIRHTVMRYALITLFGMRLGYMPYMVLSEPERIEHFGIAVALILIAIYHVAVLALLFHRAVRYHFSH